MRSKRELKIPDFVKARCYDALETDEDGSPIFEYYVLYWRKWWSFRNDVMNECGFADGDYSFPLDVDLISKIQEILEYYDDEAVWINADSIWDWNDVKDQFPEQEKIFGWLKSFKALHPDVEVIFYDSY